MLIRIATRSRPVISGISTRHFSSHSTQTFKASSRRLDDFTRGLSYIRGGVEEPDFVLANHYFYLAAQKGNPEAAFHLARNYEAGLGTEKDLEQAFLYFKEAADKGHVSALNSLGGFYENGSVVKKDLEVAFALYKAAGDGGDPLGLYNLGLLYQKGKGVERDDVKALDYFERSAKLGYDQAYLKIEELCPGLVPESPNRTKR